MTREEKIHKLIATEHDFEPALQNVLGFFRENLTLNTPDGMTPDREQALIEHEQQLRKGRDVLIADLIGIYSAFSDAELDALLVVTALKTEWITKTIAANNRWRQNAFNGSPRLHDIIATIATGWAVNNTEGETAESLAQQPLEEYTPDNDPPPRAA